MTTAAEDAGDRPRPGGDADADAPPPRIAVVRDIVSPRRGRFALVLALMAGDAALNSIGIGMVLPVLQAVMQENEVNRFLTVLFPPLAGMDQHDRVLTLAGATIALFGVRAVVAYLYVSRARAFAESLRVSWIDGIGRNYLLGPYARLLGRRQGELLNNWQMETASASRFFMTYFSYLSTALQSAALIVMGLIVSWPIMLGTLAAGGLLYAVLRGVAFGTATRLGERKLAVHQDLTARMAENLGNARDIKLLGAETRRLAELRTLADELKSIFVRITVYGEMPRILAEVFAVVALMALIVITIVGLGMTAAAVLPMLAFFLLVFYRLATATSQMVGARMKTLNELHAVALVHRLATATDREDTATGREIDSLPGDIAFEAVRYGYGGEAPVLAELDLRIPRGRVTFLVGPSGSGKSTVLDLLMRLDAPQAGRVSVGGIDAGTFALASWRALFGYVSQDAALFNGTIRSNLLLARPDASEARMEEVCRLAGVTAFLDALPAGLDTPVGDRGYTLSGGQRKRIAIARALLADPAVLVLDEATTSFEERMERDMIAGLRTARPGLTVIQVTHRLQTADGADHVIVLEAGRVAAAGPWEEIGDRRRPALGGGAGTGT